MNRVLVILICTAIISLNPVLTYAQRGGFGGFGGKPNPALAGKKIINKVTLYNSSKYDDKKSGQLIAHEKLKREILETISSEVMSSFKEQCPGRPAITPHDTITLMSSLLNSEEGNTDWDDGVLEYQLTTGISISDLARLLCYIASSELLVQQIKKNQEYADEALEKIFLMHYDPYSKNKQASYDRALDSFRATDFFKRGIFAGLIKDYDEAVDAFTDAIDLNPQFPVAFYQRASSYRGLSNNSKALEDYSQAIRLDPTEAIYYTSRALCYLDTGSLDAAVKDLSSVIDMNPSSSDLYAAYVLRGTVYERNKEDIKALQDYTRAIEINPGSVDIHFRMGLVNRRLKNYEESIEDFCRVIELDAANGDAYYERGTTYAYLKDKDNVLKDFKSAARCGNSEAKEFLKSKNIKWD